MQLTALQLQTLKTDLSTNTNTVLINGVATAINAVPRTTDNAFVVAAWYDLAVSPNYYVIRTDAPVADIKNSVVWSNYTPNVTITTSTTAQTANQATAASNYCMLKRDNMLGILGPGTTGTFDATKATATAGLKDSTTALPAGAGFAAVAAGWTAICQVLQRPCLNIEKLFVVANTTVPTLQNGVSARGTLFDGTNGNPDIMSFEGSISYQDILNAWAS